MIRAIFVVGSIWLCSQGYAQGIPEAEINIERLNKLRGKDNTMPVPRINLNPSLLRGANTIGETPVYVGSNALGEVYELPQDNMPMLKPYQLKENSMPGTQVRQQPHDAELSGRIPNAVSPRVYRFVPDDQPRKK
jgi:hypothetical protein